MSYNQIHVFSDSLSSHNFKNKKTIKELRLGKIGTYRLSSLMV